MRTVIGCMSGTSMDAVDAALVSIDGHGLDMCARFVQLQSEPLGDLQGDLLSVASGAPLAASEQAQLSRRIGEAHVRAISRLGVADQPVDLICAHGQTVFHSSGLTAQWLDPWPIALACACPVVFDLRRADVALGGEGAPITPIADWVLFRDQRQSRAIVNLGGFCNITVLPAGGGVDSVRGFDVCACNQILDESSRRVLGQAFDRDGQAALRGAPHHPATDELLLVVEQQATANRSLGAGDEGRSWIGRWENRLNAPDLLASACRAIGQTIGERVRQADRVILAGGGAKNRALVAAIEDASDAPVALADEFGVPAQAREAAAMAILGAMCADGQRITLSDVTGRSDAPLLDGCWVNAKVAL